HGATEEEADNNTQEQYKRTKGFGTAPQPDTEDSLGNPFVLVIETNGIHHLPLHLCTCPGVLDDFRLSNLTCKTSAYQYYLKLQHLTSLAFPKSVPDRYRGFRRVSRQWRNLELKKCFGFGHEPRMPKAGEMAYGCASCAQPGVNLPMNWKEDPHP
ncbi:uncharacterized protein LACBIDRAFT_310563, partial [Laccaria bicolor S238N-H82]